MIAPGVLESQLTIAPPYAGVVGLSVPLDGAVDMATGALKYFTDLQMEGTCYGGVFRAQVAHARLRAVEIQAARGVTGVVAVLTASDVPQNELEAGVVLVDSEVRQVGDPIALVVAETPDAVKRGLDAIRVEFESLPVLSTWEEALVSGVLLHESGNLLAEIEHQRGDVEGRLAAAEVVIDRRTRTPSQEHLCLEPGGGVAVYESGRFTIWCGTQHPDPNRVQVAHALKVPAESVRIISTPMGGSFGSKGDGPLPIHLALMARAVGRPVKLVLSREEVIITGTKRHSSSSRTRLGVSAAGRFLALDVDLVLDTGPYAAHGSHVLLVAAELSVGPYRIDAARFHGRVVHTNNANSGAFRGYGAPQAAFGLETAISAAAARLAIDPVELRRRNVLKPGDRHSLYGHRTDWSLRASEVLETVAAHEWWRERDKWAGSGSGSWVRGTGVALAMKGVGMGSARGDVARARLDISEDNQLEIFVGPNHSGQWIQTTYRQIAADTLRLPAESVKVTIGDTDHVPESGGCAASRSTYAGGSAVEAVCKELLRQVEAVGLSEPFDWALALPLLRQAGIHELAAEFELPDVEADDDIGDEIVRRYAPHATYGSSAQVARVEVNRLTGEMRVASVACAVDCGRAINPDSVVGQAEGGILQGVGLAQMEEYIIADGLPVTKNLESYLIPTAVDAPDVAVLLVESGEVKTAFGAKGMAEVVCVPTAPAIVAAVHEATGVIADQLPVTAERLYRSLVESDAGRPPASSQPKVSKEN